VVHWFWVASCHSLVVVSYPPCPFPHCASCHHYCRSTCNPPHEQLPVGLEAGGALSSVIHHSFVVLCRSFIIVCHRSFIVLRRLSYIIHSFVISCLLIGICHSYLFLFIMCQFIVLSGHGPMMDLTCSLCTQRPQCLDLVMACALQTTCPWQPLPLQSGS
jgi:hypothetical protein